MLVGASPRRVAIVGGVRIPFVRGNGAYAQVGNQEMLTAALRGVVERYGLQGQRLDDVAAGAVMKHSSQWNLTRESVLGSGLAAETPGLDLQRACGTSLEAAILLGNKIALGQIDCAIAGGVDTVSDPPVVYPRSFQQLLLRSYRGKTLRRTGGALVRLAPEEFAAGAAGDRGAAHRLVHGREHRTHGEDLGNHARRAGPTGAGKPSKGGGGLRSRVLQGSGASSISGVTQDNNIRSDSTLEKLAKLKPVFDSSGAGTLDRGKFHAR